MMDRAARYAEFNAMLDAVAANPSLLPNSNTCRKTLGGFNVIAEACTKELTLYGIWESEVDSPMEFYVQRWPA